MLLATLAAQAVLPAEWAQLLQQQQAAAGRPAAPAFAQAMQPPQWPFPAQAQQPAQNPMAMMAALMGGVSEPLVNKRNLLFLTFYRGAHLPHAGGGGGGGMKEPTPSAPPAGAGGSGAA